MYDFHLAFHRLVHITDEARIMLTLTDRLTEIPIKCLLEFLKLYSDISFEIPASRSKLSSHDEQHQKVTTATATTSGKNIRKRKKQCDN